MVTRRSGDVTFRAARSVCSGGAKGAGKLSPEERAAFVKMLQERAAERGIKLPRQVASDPKDLGQVLTDCISSPVSSGISSALASLRGKRQGSSRTA